MMDKVQKHNSFNTNTPSSESYRNQTPVCLARDMDKLCFMLTSFNNVLEQNII
jgi:hypothetical protein